MGQNNNSNSMNTSKQASANNTQPATVPPVSMPGVLCDIDGVFYRGGKIVGNSPTVISDILLKKYDRPNAPEGVHLPFVCLTNGGMYTEVDKVISLNKKLDITQYQKDNADRHPELE